MHDDIYADLLGRQGFREIARFSHRFHFAVWWNEDAKIEVAVLPVGASHLLKATKGYYLRSISEEGASWARDIGPLHDYLEAHFPELHLSFSFFRDVTPTLAARHVATRFPGAESSAGQEQLEEQIARSLRDRDSTEALRQLDSGDNELLGRYFADHERTLRANVDELRAELQGARERSALYENLQEEYLRNGSAASLLFQVSSHLQVATSPPEFGDALGQVVKELADLHRFQVQQKLAGGRLNIQLAEATQPELVWLEAWFGGALSPRQLESLSPEFGRFRDAATEHLMVTVDEDIRVAGKTKEDKKLLPARAVSSLLGRLDRPQAGGGRLKKVTQNERPLTLGRLLTGNGALGDPCRLPLNHMGHTYLSGMTGSGKSYCGRVVLEEALAHGVNVLVLDPRNQSVGMLLPEDRGEILALYPEFGLSTDQPRGFALDYYAPGANFNQALPDSLHSLGRGQTIVTFKGLDDERRCALFADILTAVFEDHARKESAALQTIVCVEEAHLFTKRKVAPAAKSAGQGAEVALDRVVREGRKYGLAAFVLSQTIRDFAYEAASVRQNMKTRVFLQNTDREVEYAADFIGDGRQIIQLPPATAIVHNALWGAVPMRIRPPFSKVWEFSLEESQQIVAPPEASNARAVSEEATALMAELEERHARSGLPIPLTEIAQRLGVTSKRRLYAWVAELEQAGLVHSYHLQARGKPRVLEPISSARADTTADETGTESG